MYRRIFLLILACSLAVGKTSFGDEPGRTIRVLTYNIHHGEGADGKLDLERIAKVIMSEKPDLVALQEVDQKTKRTGGVDQLERLAILTGMFSTFGPAMDYQGGSYGVGILSRWPLIGAKTHSLPAPTGVEPRAVLSAEVAIDDRGTKIRFLGTHVDHRSDPAQRTAQVARIRELFPPKPDGLSELLAGDFNATPDSEVIKSLLTEWTDTASGQTFLTSPAGSPKRRIDYILLRPSTGWRVVETRALDESVASDHRPVLAILEKLK
jgi:endonuclease/exonuclease/phosphatase family metal-dependent hydrolase